MYLFPCNKSHRKCICRCQCGRVFVRDYYEIKSGASKSCSSCSKIKDEMVPRRTKLYFVWAQMKGRCLNPNNPEFKNYGKRGITVCEEWCEDYGNFFRWAKKNGYKEGLTIDRINNNGNYCPENCRWTDVHTQNANRRTLSRNTSGATGVYFYKDGRKRPYQSYLSKKTIGYFASFEEAVAARERFIREHNLTEYMKTGSIFV